MAKTHSASVMIKHLKFTDIFGSDTAIAKCNWYHHTGYVTITLGHTCVHLELREKSWKEGGGWSTPRLHAVLPSRIKGPLRSWIKVIPALSALAKTTGLPITQLRNDTEYVHVTDFDKLGQIAVLVK